MARRLTLVGDEFQVNVNSGGNNGLSGSQTFPDAVALTDGRFVIAYQSDYFGSATDNDPIVRILGRLNYLDVFNAGGQQTSR